MFAYTVRIANEGRQTAQLKSRHWVITHGNGQMEEVRGPGVVGQQPVLQPGEHFEYTSGCVLETPRGQMHGTYQMHTSDGKAFDAEIGRSSWRCRTRSTERHGDRRDLRRRSAQRGGRRGGQNFVWPPCLPASL